MTHSRALVGPALTAVGAAHVGLTAVRYRDEVRSVLDAGVLNGVRAGTADPAAATSAFWFATTGIGLAATGIVVTSLEHHVVPLPRSLPWVLLGVGAWGVVLLPASPFWAFPALALVAEVRRRRIRP